MTFARTSCDCCRHPGAPCTGAGSGGRHRPAAAAAGAPIEDQVLGRQELISRFSPGSSLPHADHRDFSTEADVMHPSSKLLATVCRCEQRDYMRHVCRRRIHWHNGYMNPAKTNNDRLRELVEASGLSQPAALAVFNLGLGPAAYSINTFKAFLVRADSPKFRPLKDELLAHAEKNFKQHIKAS